MATATEVKTHTFYSRGRNERLVRQPLVRTLTAIGTQSTVQTGVRYEFAPDGWLTVREGQDMLPDGPIDENGQHTMQDAVAWLTSHPLFNTRFWKEGEEPDRLRPTENEFFDVVTKAAAELDPAPIVVALQRERDSHNRKVLVQAGERALEQIERTKADVDAKAAKLEAKSG